MINIVLVNMYLLSKNVDVISWLGDMVLAELVKKSQHFETYVEAGIEYFLEGGESARLP